MNLLAVRVMVPREEGTGDELAFTMVPTFLYGVSVSDDGLDESTLADSLYVRYCVQDALSRIVPHAVELLGDLNSTASDEVGYLATYATGLALHPPAQSQMAGPLAAYLDDGRPTMPWPRASSS
ncbi:hypothetical protein [Nonomuraea sp. NPDC003709]|uniref:hypothetical protein n=1 Tax=Nonomuraea sp. NPDC003709 TaxID=3154450 RepID=UPI0033A5A308